MSAYENLPPAWQRLYRARVSTLAFNIVVVVAAIVIAIFATIIGQWPFAVFDIGLAAVNAVLAVKNARGARRILREEVRN